MKISIETHSIVLPKVLIDVSAVEKQKGMVLPFALRTS